MDGAARDLVSVRPIGGPYLYLAGHGLLGLLIGAGWAVVLLLWRLSGHRQFVFGLELLVPAIPLWVGFIALARRNRNVWVSVVGAGVAAATLVATQVVAIRIVYGPIEEIGTGGAMILGMIFVALPEFVVGAVSGGIVAWKRGRTDRRKRAGCCVACGYSLAGLASGVCPECGRAV